MTKRKDHLAHYTERMASDLCPFCGKYNHPMPTHGTVAGHKLSRADYCGSCWASWTAVYTLSAIVTDKPPDEGKGDGVIHDG